MLAWFIDRCPQPEREAVGCVDKVECGFDSFWESEERGEVERALSDILSELTTLSIPPLAIE